MIKLILLFAFFCTILDTTAQELYSDDSGVKVFYEIKKTDKVTFCNPILSTDANYSEKKILVWKITLGIKNGHKNAIVPRGVGIANISIHPNPLKPYANDYCSYKKVVNYEPSDGWLDHSLFAWPIREFRVEEIPPNATLTNSTYLYLYEGQTPKLTNSEFLGYQLKEVPIDKKSILIVDSSSSTVPPDSSDNQENSPLVLNISIDQVGETNTKEKFEEDKNDVVEIKKNTIPKEIENKEVNPVDTLKVSVTENMPIVNSNPVKEIKEASTNEVVNANKCDGAKALEYKNKVTTDASEQRAYSWLALYYTYKCECENGSYRSNDLTIIINNVVDNYSVNTNNAFGLISKVTKCNKLGE